MGSPSRRRQTQGGGRETHRRVSARARARGINLRDTRLPPAGCSAPMGHLRLPAAAPPATGLVPGASARADSRRPHLHPQPPGESSPRLTQVRQSEGEEKDEPSQNQGNR